VIIATKGGARFSEGVTRPDFSSSYLQSAVEHSLKRLQREFIDLYQLHCPPLALLQDGELFDTLRGLRKRGLIRHFGVSVHTPQEARAVLAIPGVAALQIPYSILSMLEPDFSCGEILPLAASANVGIIAREPLAAGMLSGKHNVGREYEPGDLRGGWTAARRRLYVALAASLKHLERPGVTLAQAALRFALDEPTITTTIVGMKTPQQVAENLAAVYVPSFERLYASRTESNSSISGAV
jgi:aryl-alcohol dehydrogenase-like predicted oxidoreductase